MRGDADADVYSGNEHCDNVALDLDGGGGDKYGDRDADRGTGAADGDRDRDDADVCRVWKRRRGGLFEGSISIRSGVHFEDKAIEEIGIASRLTSELLTGVGILGFNKNVGNLNLDSGSEAKAKAQYDPGLGRAANAVSMPTLDPPHHRAKSSFSLAQTQVQVQARSPSPAPSSSNIQIQEIPQARVSSPFPAQEPRYSPSQEISPVDSSFAMARPPSAELETYYKRMIERSRPLSVLVRESLASEMEGVRMGALSEK
ncbi:hypothetical protein M422DRAFT_241628 [Sphaerobolus stellatus SS14]|nr:hypothetical protein M422DRAFT_241628 [Sphaerobolus stellatus SS14]